MRRRSTRLFTVLLALTLTAAACGRDDDDGGGGEGLTAGPGFDGTTIKVGVLEDQSGPLKDIISKPLSAGADLYWQKINAAGGVAGKYKVEQVKRDIIYSNTGGKTSDRYEEIKNEVVLFSQVLGTPSTQAILGKLPTDQIVALPASLDAAWVKEKHLMPVGSTYQIQFINAASYLIDDAGFKGKPICSLSVESEYGNAGKEGLAYAAKELGFTVAAAETITGAATEDYTSQIGDLQAAKCEAVFLTALPNNTSPIINFATGRGFKPRWIGQSPTWITALAANPNLQQSFWLTSEGTTWGDETVEGMKEMIADVKKLAPTQVPDIYFVFGYAQAKAAHALLEEAVDGDDLSRAGVLAALEDVEVDFKGLLGNYKYGKAADREPARETVIYKVVPANPASGALEKVAAVTSDAAKEFDAG